MLFLHLFGRFLSSQLGTYVASRDVNQFNQLLLRSKLTRYYDCQAAKQQNTSFFRSTICDSHATQKTAGVENISCLRKSENAAKVFGEPFYATVP